MIILGIDPGLRVCGYGVIRAEGGNEELIEAGVFRSDSAASLEKRLAQISADTESIIDTYMPTVVAVEELYAHYKHPRTAILMGHARGVILLAAAKAGSRVESFTATRIKKSLTGNGRAGKGQMQRAIQTLLALPDLPEPADVADAIAAALCCANELRLAELS